MRRFVVRLLSLSLPVLALSGASTLAHAEEGEACLRDSACAGVELCFEGVCTQSEEALPVCTEGDTSLCGAAEICVDALCKRDDPVCRNALGVCFFGETQGECLCVNAPGIEWEGDPPDVGSPSEDPTGLCFDVLAATCPAAVPEPACDTDAQRTECQAFVAQENALNESCGGTSNDDPVRIAGAIEFCCGEFEESGVADYRVCVLGLEPDDCAGFEACARGEEPIGGSSGGAPVEDPTEDEPFSGEAEPEEDPIGCQVGGAGSAWLGALLLFGMIGMTGGERRRRQ